MNYDTRTTTYSPEGELFQIKYAIKAIENADAAVGILAKDGVVVAAEKKIISKLLTKKPNTSEKIYMIDDHIAVAVAGLNADASVLVKYLRQSAQYHYLTYQTPIPMDSLINKVCDLKQGYTQYGGMRPFGVSFIYAGFDEHYGFQLYKSDPSGNYGGWKACSIGANNTAADSLLKTEYKENLSIDEALELAVKVLTKSMDTTSPTSEKMEFIVLKKDPITGKLVQELLKEDVVDDLLEKFAAANEDEGDV